METLMKIILNSILLGLSALTFTALVACKSSESNLTSPVSDDVVDTVETSATPSPYAGIQFEGRGFGVSGLLFENNLIMWFRENNGRRSERFPQMYGTRSDAANYPVWGTFPENFITFGGVAKDGVPALVNPKSVSRSSIELNYLDGQDLVLGVVINGEAKAYPENVLWWHEVVNDVVGGVPVIISLCPLTGTGIVYKMPENPDTIDQLEMLPVIETTWNKWRKLYPRTVALSSNTGFDRDYQRYPYDDYREDDTAPLFVLRSGQTIDNRFPNKHTVLGVIINGNAKAYAFSKLQGTQIINDSHAGLDILVVSELGASLAVPYDREVDGQVLTFVRGNNLAEFEMIDNETGSSWNILGVVTSGPLLGKRLRQIPAYNAFWFAWSIFWPNTEIY